MKLNLRENTGDYQEFRERKTNVTTLILPQIKQKSMQLYFYKQHFFSYSKFVIEKKAKKDTCEDHDRKTDMKI